MSYRNKTYVAFASEDIISYRLMLAWNASANIDFDFYNAHDLNTARDTSKPETIKRRLRERLNNTKQAILLGSPKARRKGSDGISFLAYEVEVLIELELPVVIANLDKSELGVARGNIPMPFGAAEYYTVSVAFRPKIIKYALDNYVPGFSGSDKIGPHEYPESVYKKLGL